MTTIFNPSPLPTREQISNIPWKEVDWLIVNEGEAEGLWRALSPDKSATVRSAETQDVVRMLSEEPSFVTTNIICTLGASGVLAFIPAFHQTATANKGLSCIHVPAAKLQGNVRDTTGAGDCFTGYFVQGLMEHGRTGKKLSEKDIEGILHICVHVIVL